MELFTLGIDLGKTTFHLVGMNRRGEVVLRRSLPLPESRLATTELHSPGDVFPSAAHRDQPRPKAVLSRSSHRRLLFFLPSLTLSKSTQRTTTHGSKGLPKLHEINDE